MERLPDPPTVAELLDEAPPAKRVLPAGTRLWRIFYASGKYRTTWRRFRTFGPMGARFDHHPDASPRRHKGRGILYAAQLPVAAFAEFFQDTRTIDRTNRAPHLVQFALRQPLTLLDLTGSWMLKVGGGPQIATGERSQARKWSRVFHEAYPDIDGLCYPSSLNTTWHAYALYERAERAMPSAPVFNARLTAAASRVHVAAAVRETHYDVL